MIELDINKRRPAPADTVEEETAPIPERPGFHLAVAGTLFLLAAGLEILDVRADLKLAEPVLHVFSPLA